ncbi:EamA family transporter [Acinetobacter baumannii]|uniref:DMT family transporter n=1 Tax=Acinetobacter baumannii TaxID=470 RepID=UPI001C0BC4F7|nr:EamA family transporter [Acinetobacter baumannii]MBU3082488.1 EamA family transporter [Acinetobacter baumannii]MDC4652079.1 EamA family transporter [Acinetobacter baumannii]MDC5449581.1 EamA family transporter [Acinetobacter baumannii]
MSTKDSILCILVMFLWGAQVSFVKIAEMEIPPFFMLALRFLIIALFTLPFVLTITKKDFFKIALITVFVSILHFGCLYIGISLVKASTSAILYQLSSIFTILLAIFFLKERITLARSAGVGLSLLGVLILFGGFEAHESLLGGFLVVFAALSFAIGTTLIKKIGPINGLTLNGWSAIIAAPAMFIISFSTENVNYALLANVSTKGWLCVLYTALIGGVISFFLWYQLIGRNQISRLAPFTLLTPIFAVLVSQIVLNETLSLRFMASTLIVLLGVVVAQFGWPKLQFKKA